MKKAKSLLIAILLIAILGGMALVNFWTGPKPIKVVTGWQKFEEINGIIPKGAYVVVSSFANFVALGNHEIKELDGFITEGVIIFCESRHCFSQGSVWIYIPEDYDFIIKLNGFSTQCDEKLSDLVGEEKEVKSTYVIGHP